MKKYQVTLYDKTNTYKPVSCIVTMNEIDMNDKNQRKVIIREGTNKICRKRYWTKNDILRYNFLVAKIREVE